MITLDSLFAVTCLKKSASFSHILQVDKDENMSGDSEVSKVSTAVIISFLLDEADLLFCSMTKADA